MTAINDQKIPEKISQRDVKAFEELFRFYYKPLCLFASGLLNDNESAEEIVQDTFVRIWEKKLNITASVKNYLYTAVRNQCLNHIRRQKTADQLAQKLLEESPEEPDTDPGFLDPDLAGKIEASINSLPRKRREIFRLNREEGLKYREIAERLNISVKTVEAQMSLAIKTLRKKMKNYQLFLFFFIF